MKDWGIDKSWSLFLDRDGVINERIMGGYIRTVSQFHFIANVPEAISALTTIFQFLFVVTNQQGIAKELMTERNLSDIHAYMLAELEKKNGIITKCYHAPGMKNDSNSTRKPNPNMGWMAQQDFPAVCFNKSIMVGDTDTDIQFGKNLGMKTVRIKTEEPIGIEADLTFSSLFEFAKEVQTEI